eukprot:CAMPEP_0119321240 /NCGR_PEP_ID=MMETSP1333-20130426/54851_1 /TAXON_ID=418940 /ORGANISM="Scyphosphaera apsteinii, Strain RCC1455" /LENGTH=388 /DNA_ID=CAMNT_0007328179 /DNA_START=13 /DNA_END=1179 /DNA_ORIENTATION=+
MARVWRTRLAIIMISAAYISVCAAVEGFFEKHAAKPTAIDINGDGKKEHAHGKDVNHDGKIEVYVHDVDGDGKREHGKDVDGDGRIEFHGKEIQNNPHGGRVKDSSHPQGTNCTATEAHGVDLAADCAAVAISAVEGMLDSVAGSNHSVGIDKLEAVFEGFGAGFLVILATEVGDKTFFIAAILAMTHPRLIVWSGAIGALIVMTVLAVLLGWLAPQLLPPVFTHYAAICLFIFFGGRMLLDGRSASSGASEELAEVEEELHERAAVPTSEAGAAELEQGTDEHKVIAPVVRKSTAKGVLVVMVQAFTLTFAAEWGDRSQIATIALAADNDAIGVTLGGIVGHSICTAFAVLGGKLLASSISERTVLLTGGALFILFALLELIHGSSE